MQNSAPRRSFLRVDDTDIHWVEMGEGRPIVLLHGLANNYRTWLRIAPALARTHRVLMPDLAGHGLSSRPDASYSLAWHASVMGRWMDALDLDGIDLVGHSYGGGVAQWMLLDRGPRIRRLALVAAGGLGREVNWGLRLCASELVERLGQPFMGIGTRLGLSVLDADFDEEDLVSSSWMSAMPGTARAFARTVRDVIGWEGQRRHFLDRAREVEKMPPICVYWGDRDPILPARHAVDAAALLDGAELVRFEGCGHFPHREFASDFAREIEAYLDAPSSTPARLRRNVVVSSAELRRKPSFFSLLWQSVAAGVKAIFAPAPTIGSV